MRLMIESRYVGLVLCLGDARKAEAEEEYAVSNTGGDFHPAPAADDDFDPEEFFGFRGPRHG